MDEVTRVTEREEVYRKPAINGWVRIDPCTDALRVPGGMIVRCSGEQEWDMVFVPCDAYDRRDWLASNEAS